MRRIILTGIIFINCLSLFAGGGWTSKKGEGYFKLGQSVMVSDKLYNAEAKTSDITTAGVYITGFYGEYGLNDRLEAMLQFPIFFRMTINELRYKSGREGVPGDEFNYIGDPCVGLKYALIHNKPFVLSAGFRLDFPAGKTDGGDSKLLQTGDGEFNQLIKIESGYSFHGNKLYMAAGAGFNNRTNKFSDEFQYYYEAGYKFAPAWVLSAVLRGTESFFNGASTTNSNGIFSNNMEQMVVSPQLACNFKNNFGVALSVAYPLQGRNILAAPAYEASIFYKLRKK